MTTCKTGAEHLKSLKDGRTVYIDGKLVADVTEHPAFRNSVKSAAMLYDFQAKPENIDLMTFVADAAQVRRNGAAAQSHAGLGRPLLWLHGPFARSPCLRVGRPAHGHRSLRKARSRAR